MATNPNKLFQFWQELRRRKVLPFVIGYIAACFAIIEFVLNASETFSVPEYTIKLLNMLSAIGIPLMILLPWYFNRKKAVPRTGESYETGIQNKPYKPQRKENSIIVLLFENISPDPKL